MCKLLRQWRVAAALTQRAMGQRMRKPYSFVWKVEAGERRIDPIEFIAWCRACGVPPGGAIEDLER
jgi:transcriptional regulator with XRE-family HTH domain